MAAFTAQVILFKNSMLLELQDLTNSKTQAVITSATVTVTLKDSTGAEVAGETWPLAMGHVSGGTYDATLLDTLVLVNGDQYTAEITAVDAGLTGFWALPLTVKDRKFI